MTRDSQISSSLEDYLEAIYHTENAKGAARAKDLVQALGVQNSSVTQALRALSERHLVNYAPYDVITLTDPGRRLARDVVKRHTTMKAFLTQVLGLPEDAAEAYGIADCLPLADRLQGDMLLTIGTSDRNTPFGQSMRMLDAFQAAGKDMDLVVFPGENHWLQGASYERWKRALREYFLEHLPPDPR